MREREELGRQASIDGFAHEHYSCWVANEKISKCLSC